ncbi:hypothetical protein A7982_12173 [Minicystis rosea]|nr:hypothetical protein A7982_12173 [Minicystis rosea]
MSQKVFHPEPTQLRRALALNVVIYLVAAPILCWWKGAHLPRAWLIAALALGLVAIVAPPLVRLLTGRLDLIGVGPEGLLVSRPKGGFVLPWTEVARIYRFNEHLIVETVAPVRRETIRLDGHGHHEDAIFEAMKEHAKTVNLTLLQSLSQLGGAAR